jgi:hypothetical protein
LRYRSHASYRMSPDPGLAIHFAEHVVEKHVGAAGGVWLA